MKHRPGLGYVFERFPSFTQTFCYREVRELAAQGMEPLVHAIRPTNDEPPQDYPPDFERKVIRLPDGDVLAAEMKRARADKSMPRPIRKTLEAWTSKQDRHRVYEAAWLGPRLHRAGIRHVHAHFAGIAARTAFWLHRFFGISCSFTGHANDLFCPEDDLPVRLADLVREAALVVAVSDHTRDDLSRRFPEAARRIRRVYNGIDTRLWTPAESTPRDVPLVISVGRLIEKKGFADLIRASALLQRRGVIHRCRIIGEGPLQEELAALIAAEGCVGTVELAGPLDQAAIRAALQGASAFALPCVHESGGGRDVLPTVIMEAMACGLPCVSTPVAGVPELIADGRTGLLVPEHNPEALADALGSLLADPAKARAMGAAGRASAEAVFDIRTTTRQLKLLLVRCGKVFPGAPALRADPALWKSWAAGMLLRGASMR
jgi:colanic acid/amylovoran biosynthesis glycosyltransferase